MSAKDLILHSTGLSRPADNAADAEAGTYLNSAHVLDRYKISVATLYRWERDEALGFPRPVVLSRRKLYRLGDLVAWERSRAAVARRSVA